MRVSRELKCVEPSAGRRPTFLKQLKPVINATGLDTRWVRCRCDSSGQGEPQTLSGARGTDGNAWEGLETVEHNEHSGEWNGDLSVLDVRLHQITPSYLFPVLDIMC